MPLILREQNQIIAVKKETTYGVDIVPAGANALLVSDIEVNTLDGPIAERNNMAGFMGNQGSVRLNQFVTVKFTVELVGAGAVDTPPAYAVLYRAAGHAETVTATTKVAYTPIEDAPESASIYYQVGVLQHKIVGVRGTLTWLLSTTGLPKLRFEGVGLFVAAPTNAGAMAGVSFASLAKPRPVNKSTVPTCTLDTTAVAMRELTLTQGADVKYIATVGSETVEQVSRSSEIDLLIREDDVTPKNWWDLCQKNAEVAFAFQRGINVTDAGHIFEAAVANIQLKNCVRSFQDGLAYLRITGAVRPTTKNSDYTITHR
ncbi:MAG: phage tail tube protein [Pseudomonadota bacterium]